MSDVPSPPGAAVRREALVVSRIAALVAIAFSTATAVDYYGSSPRFCRPGAGCDAVHAWSTRFHLDSILPALGLVFYSSVLVASLVGRTRALRTGAAAAALGGLGALGFIVLQKTVIGAWCWLCLGVDSAAIVAAIAGMALLRGRDVATPSRRARAAWSLVYVLALAMPLAWSMVRRPITVQPSFAELPRAGNVRVVVWTEPECPYCRLLHGVLGDVVSGSDDIEVSYVLVPLPMHALARDATKAVLCADLVGQGAAMRDLVYTTDDLGRAGLASGAARLGLDTVGFATCLDAVSTEERVVANVALAEKAHIEGLPTVSVNGIVIIGYDARRGAEPYRAAVEQARQALRD